MQILLWWIKLLHKQMNTLFASFYYLKSIKLYIKNANNPHNSQIISESNLGHFGGVKRSHSKP